MPLQVLNTSDKVIAVYVSFFNVQSTKWMFLLYYPMVKYNRQNTNLGTALPGNYQPPRQLTV